MIGLLVNPFDGTTNSKPVNPVDWPLNGLPHIDMHWPYVEVSTPTIRYNLHANRALKSPRPVNLTDWCTTMFEHWDLCAHEPLGHGHHPQSGLPLSNCTPTCRLLGLPLLWNMMTSTPSDPLVFYLGSRVGILWVHMPPPEFIPTGGMGWHSGPLQYTNHLTPWNAPFSVPYVQ